MDAGPPAKVLAAFGAARAEPVPLPSGEGRSWMAGDLVFKTADNEASDTWAAALLSRVREDGFRVARPVASSDGRWITDGWTASRRLDGEHAPRWTEVIAAGEAFHRAVRDEPQPDFLDERDDPWAIGDRVAWGELPIEPYAGRVEGLRRLAAARRLIGEVDAQLIHGDLTENVLFADGLTPAVIDRIGGPWGSRPRSSSPTPCCGTAPDRSSWTTPSVSRQLLLRALIYRLVTHAVFRPGWPEGADDAQTLSVASVTRAVDLVVE